MSTENRTARVEALFHDALELDEGEREAFLRAECGADDALFDELARLVGVAQRADGFLGQSGIELLFPDRLPVDGDTKLTLDGYEIRRRVGTGGMGTVYEALEETTRRTVALKLMHSVGPELERRFRFEAELLARLQHPYVAAVYAAGVLDDDGRRLPFIAMELVAGARSLERFTQEEGLDRRARIELFAKACEAVHHGHQHGVVHRDLKPTNILVAADGTPRLIDFGIARALDVDASRHTRAGALLGTVAYMSPEQGEDASAVDVRGDVYSLGVILYELLCGRLPYDLTGMSLPEATRAVQEREPIAPSTLDPALRGDLETIVLRAIEKERGRRFDTVEDLRSDLLRHLAGEPIASRPPGFARQLASLARRHRLAVAVLAVLLAASIVVAAFSTTFAVRVERARQAERRQAARAGLAAADASLRVFDGGAALRSLNAVPDDLRGWAWGHLRAQIELERLVLECAGARCEGVRFGPDGDTLVTAWFVDDQGQLVLSDAATGATRARIEVDNPLDLDLDPEQGRVLVTTRDELVLWSADLATELWRVASDGGVFLSSDFDETGARVATVTEDGRVLVLDATRVTWVAQAVAAPGSALHAVAFGPGPLDLLAAGDDGTLFVFDRALTSAPRALAGHTGPILALDAGPVPRLAVSASSDGTLRVWDIVAGRELQRMHGHVGEVVSCELARDGTSVLSASTDGTARIFDLASGAPRRVLFGHKTWLTACAWSPDAREVATTSLDGTARVFDAVRSDPSHALGEHAKLVRDLAFDPAGRWLASCSFDCTVRLTPVGTDGADGPFTLEGHTRRVGCVAWQPDADRLVSGSNDATVRVWSAASAECEAVLEGFDGAVHALAFDPSGKELAVGASTGEVSVWDASTWSRVRTFPGEASLADLDWSSDGTRIAVADERGLRVLDARTGATRLDIETTDPLRCVAFTPSGEFVVGGGLEVYWWNATSGRLLTKLDMPDAAADLAFHPSGLPLAIATSGGAVHLWEPWSPEVLLSLRGHRSWLFAVAFSPDGTELASAGGSYDDIDTSIRLWRSRWNGETPPRVVLELR